MFERYVEKARRVIFFARYEASVYGSPYIQTEHLLLGLLREDDGLRGRLGIGSAQSFREQVEAKSPARKKIGTSVDLPLNKESKRVLAYAAEESEGFGQDFIGTGHLVLGLLRIEGSLPAAFLIQHGIELAGYREVVRAMKPGEEMPRTRGVLVGETHDPRETRAPKSDSLAVPIAAINRLLDLEIGPLSPDHRLKRKPWSRREAMGHLIELASTHQQWLARALTEPKVTAAEYPGDEWVAAQQYAEYGWRELVSLWILLNRLVMHVMAGIPDEKLNTSCRIGVEEPRTLLEVIRRYVAECEDLVGQMLAKLD